MAMDEVEMSIRPGRVERTALPSMARRRRRIPANAVVCLWDGKIVNVLRRRAELRGEAYNLASCSVHSLRSAAVGAADTARHASVRDFCSRFGVRCGFYCVPDS